MNQFKVGTDVVTLKDDVLEITHPGNDVPHARYDCRSPSSQAVDFLAALRVAMKEQHQRLEVVIFRTYEDERTCAVLRCEKTDKIQTAADLREAMREGISIWARSQEGFSVLYDTKGEFGLGDVANHDQQLVPFFEQAGIVNFNSRVRSSGRTCYSTS